MNHEGNMSLQRYNTVILKRVKKIMPNGKNNDNLILKIKKMWLRCNHRSIVYEVLDRKRR